MNWIPIEKELPESGKRVIFSWINRQGFRRTSLGYYAEYLALFAEDTWDNCLELDGDAFDYKESDKHFQEPYIPKGWYEEGAEGEYCYQQNGVTHWRPLLKNPEEEQSETEG